MRTGQDDSVGQEGQGHFRMKYHIGVVKDEQGATKVAGMLRNEPGAL